MKINELIELLQKAKEKYGNIEVLTKACVSPEINNVCHVDGWCKTKEHIRLCDDMNKLLDYYEEEQIEEII